VPARSGTRTDQERDFLVLPHGRAPRWLVPIERGVPLGRLAGPGSGALTRGGWQAVSVLVGSGLTPYLPLSRVRVETGSGASLLPLLAEAVGVRDVRVAVRLGRWVEPRALVLRLFAPTGETVGFAKVSLGVEGRRSVRAETAGLHLARFLRLETVQAPPLLHAGAWRDELLLVTGPLLPGAGRSRRAPVPLRAMDEVAHARGVRRASLADSDWLVSVFERLPLVGDHETQLRLRRSLRVLQGAGAGEDVVLSFGCWHGDWTPWNMAVRDGRVLLWDWEHAGTDAPVGFDHVHHLAQRLRVMMGAGARAERRWVAEASGLLAEHFGLDRRQQDVLLVAYLLEVNLRYLLDRAGDVPVAPRAGWGMPLLEERAERLRTGASR
jgi:hypothetical protein